MSRDMKHGFIFLSVGIILALTFCWGTPSKSWVLHALGRGQDFLAWIGSVIR